MVLSPRDHGLAASVRGRMTVWPFLTCLCPHTHITGTPLDCSCVSLSAPVSGSPHCPRPLLQSTAHWGPVGRPSVGFTPAPRENSVCSFEKLWALLLMHARALLRNRPPASPRPQSPSMRHCSICLPGAGQSPSGYPRLHFVRSGCISRVRSIPSTSPCGSSLKKAASVLPGSLLVF